MDTTPFSELEELGARTRDVAARWKQMYLREEALCAEERRRARESAKAVSAARELRDSAFDARKAAQDDAAHARHEKARWRARADAQSNAKVFVEAERLRAILMQRDATIQELRAALAQARRALDKPTPAERQSVEAALQAEASNAQQMRAAAERRADKLRAEVGELQDALAHQQASFPPSALEAARASAKEAELRAARAEQTGEALRKQVDVWKERAREATRQQRLKHMEVLADAPPPAEPREGWTEKTARLEAEVAHWRAEAAGAIAASRAFQQALWASTAFTAPEKQHLVTMLRAAARADDPGPPPRTPPKSAAGVSRELPSPT